MVRNHYISMSSLLGPFILHKFCLTHPVDLSMYLHKLPCDYEGEAPSPPP